MFASIGLRIRCLGARYLLLWMEMANQKEHGGCRGPETVAWMVLDTLMGRRGCGEGAAVVSIVACFADLNVTRLYVVRDGGVARSRFFPWDLSGGGVCLSYNNKSSNRTYTSLFSLLFS